MPEANGTPKQGGDEEPAAAARSPRDGKEGAMGRGSEERDVEPKDRSRSRSRERSVTPPRRRRSPSPDRRRRRSPSPYERRRRSRSPRERRRSRSRSRDRIRDRRDDRDRRSPPRRGGRSLSPPPRLKGDVPKHLTMFVAGMTFICDERDLKHKFSKYGTVLEARVVRDNYSGSSRGFGFVSMSTDEEVDAAIDALNGREWDGRRILVERAKRT